LEKEIATHSSVLAWRIPGKGQPTKYLTITPKNHQGHQKQGKSEETVTV